MTCVRIEAQIQEEKKEEEEEKRKKWLRVRRHLSPDQHSMQLQLL